MVEIADRDRFGQMQLGGESSARARSDKTPLLEAVHGFWLDPLSIPKSVIYPWVVPENGWFPFGVPPKVFCG